MKLLVAAAFLLTGAHAWVLVLVQHSGLWRPH